MMLYVTLLGTPTSKLQKFHNMTIIQGWLGTDYVSGPNTRELRRIILASSKETSCKLAILMCYSVHISGIYTKLFRIFSLRTRFFNLHHHDFFGFSEWIFSNSEAFILKTLCFDSCISLFDVWWYLPKLNPKCHRFQLGCSHNLRLWLNRCFQIEYVWHTKRQ